MNRVRFLVPVARRCGDLALIEREREESSKARPFTACLCVEATVTVHNWPSTSRADEERGGVRGGRVDVMLSEGVRACGAGEGRLTPCKSEEDTSPLSCPHLLNLLTESITHAVRSRTLQKLGAAVCIVVAERSTGNDVIDVASRVAVTAALLRTAVLNMS